MGVGCGSVVPQIAAALSSAIAAMSGRSTRGKCRRGFRIVNDSLILGKSTQIRFSLSNATILFGPRVGKRGRHARQIALATRLRHTARMNVAADAPLMPLDGGARVFRGVPWTPRDVLVGFVLLVVALYVPSIVVVAPLLAFFDADSRPVLATAVVMAGVSSLLCGAIALRFTVWKYSVGFDALGFRPVRWSTLGWAGLALAAALGVNLAYAGIVSGLDLGFLEQKSCDQIPSGIINDNLLLVMTTVFVVGVAPITEEVFFRGFVMPGIARRWGIVAGIIATGLLFGGIHVIGNYQLYKSLIPLAATGMILAFAYYRSSNIVSSMTAHLVFNVLGSIALFTTTCPK